MIATTAARRWLIPTAALLAATGTAVARPGVLAASPTGPRVVVTDDAGTVVAEAGLPAEGFHIDYQHSYYDQPASESFQSSRASPQARSIGFRLVAVSSPSEAVLDYYDLPGARSRRPGEVHVLRPTGTAQLAELALVGTPKGRRTLVVDGHRFPLYAPSEPARHLVITIQS